MCLDYIVQLTMMGKKNITQKLITRSFLQILAIVVLLIFIRVFIIIMPPVVLGVSPKIVRLGDSFTVWGFGFGNPDRGSRVVIEDIDVSQEYIEHWGRFRLVVSTDAKMLDSLKRGGLLWVKKKQLQSQKKFVVFSTDQNITTKKSKIIANENNIDVEALEFMLKKKELYPDEKITFIIKNENSFTVGDAFYFAFDTAQGEYKIPFYLWQHNFSDNLHQISFAIPNYAFNKELNFQKTISSTKEIIFTLMYNKTKIKKFAVTVTPYENSINSNNYAVDVHLSYKNITDTRTFLWPPSTLWQQVKLSGNEKNKKLMQFIPDAYIKNYMVKDIELQITRYALQRINLNTLSVENFLFEKGTTNSSALTVTSSNQYNFFIPRYLQDFEATYVSLTQDNKEKLLKDFAINKNVVKEGQSTLDNTLLLILKESFALYQKRIEESQGLKNNEFFVQGKGAVRLLSVASENTSNIKNLEEISNVISTLVFVFRENGIMTRTVMGFDYQRNTAVTNLVPNVWLEILTKNKGWLPLKVTKENNEYSFGLLDSRYIALFVLEQYIHLLNTNQRPVLPKIESVKF